MAGHHGFSSLPRRVVRRGTGSPIERPAAIIRRGDTIMEEEFSPVTAAKTSLSPASPETEVPTNEDDSVFISPVWMEPPRSRFTIFHVLWLAGVIGAGVLGCRLSAHPDWSLFARAAVVIAAVAGGILVFHLLTILLVTVVVIPRLGRFTYWAYEVECYMLFVFGDAWRNAREVEKAIEAKTDDERRNR